MPDTSLASICHSLERPTFFLPTEIVACILNPMHGNLVIFHCCQPLIYVLYFSTFQLNIFIVSWNHYHCEMPMIWFLWIQGCSQSCPRFRPRQSIYAVDRIYTAVVHLHANNCPRQLCAIHPLLNMFVFNSLIETNISHLYERFQFRLQKMPTKRIKYFKNVFHGRNLIAAIPPPPSQPNFKLFMFKLWF